MNFKQTLFRLHFIALIVVAVSFILRNFTTIGLRSDLELILKITVIISGLTLFFVYLKNFKKINLYFSVYIILTVTLGIGLIFRGIFWGIVVAIILHPIFPEQIKYQKDKVVVYENFRGFMAMCCSYKISERKYLLLEKDYDLIETDGPIDFKTFKAQKSIKNMMLTFTTDVSNKPEQIIIKK